MKASHAESTIRVGLAKAVAETVLGGIRECACENVPLDERQQHLLLQNALMTYRSEADEMLLHLKLDEEMARVAEIRPESRRG